MNDTDAPMRASFNKPLHLLSLQSEVSIVTVHLSSKF